MDRSSCVIGYIDGIRNNKHDINAVENIPTLSLSSHIYCTKKTYSWVRADLEAVASPFSYYVLFHILLHVFLYASAIVVYMARQQQICALWVLNSFYAIDGLAAHQYIPNLFVLSPHLFLRSFTTHSFFHSWSQLYRDISLSEPYVNAVVSFIIFLNASPNVFFLTRAACTR